MVAADDLGAYVLSIERNLSFIGEKIACGSLPVDLSSGLKTVLSKPYILLEKDDFSDVRVKDPDEAFYDLCLLYAQKKRPLARLDLRRARRTANFIEKASVYVGDVPFSATCEQIAELGCALGRRKATDFVLEEHVLSHVLHRNYVFSPVQIADFIIKNETFKYELLLFSGVKNIFGDKMSFKNLSKEEKKKIAEKVIDGFVLGYTLIKTAPKLYNALKAGIKAYNKTKYGTADPNTDINWDVSKSTSVTENQTPDITDKLNEEEPYNIPSIFESEKETSASDNEGTIQKPAEDTSNTVDCSGDDDVVTPNIHHAYMSERPGFIKGYGNIFVDGIKAIYYNHKVKKERKRKEKEEKEFLSLYGQGPGGIAQANATFVAKMLSTEREQKRKRLEEIYLNNAKDMYQKLN